MKRLSKNNWRGMGQRNELIQIYIYDRDREKGTSMHIIIFVCMCSKSIYILKQRLIDR